MRALFFFGACAALGLGCGDGGGPGTGDSGSPRDSSIDSALDDAAAADAAAVDSSTSGDAGSVDAQLPDSGPRSCGGRGGGICLSNEFCSYRRVDICGGADATGLCQPRPEACPPVVAPVCGCDGADYSSECDANRAGTSVSHDGACVPP